MAWTRVGLRQEWVPALRLLGSFVFVLFASVSLAATEARRSDSCGAGDGGWNYCVHRYSGGNPTVLYYIHGYTESHKGWSELNARNEYHQRLRLLQERLGEKSPTVVLVSYAGGYDSWLLTRSEARKKSPKLATLKHFTEVVMPLIEARYGLKGPRVLYGMSMGGFNAAQLCLEKPELWNRCLLQNPMIVSCEPFDFTCLAGFIVRSNFDKAEWAENDPLQYVGKVDGKRLPPLLLTAARNDKWRLFEGTKALAEALVNRGARVEWQETNKGHDWFDVDKVYEFLTR